MSEPTNLKSKADQSEAENARSRDQYNGIIDTQMAVIDELKAEVERLKSITDHLSAATKMIWQPIATAQRISNGEDNRSVGIFLWRAGQKYPAQGGWVVTSQSFWTSDYGFCDYTHWMPLPAPPIL